MAEWTDVRLGDLVSIKHGYAFDGKFFRDEPPGDILLSPGNFAVGGGFQQGKRRYFRGPVPAEFILETGDLLVTMTDLSKSGDTLGYPALVPPGPSGMRYLHNQRLGKVEVRPDVQVEPRYLYYLLCDRPYRDEVLASATGSTVRHTAPSRIEAYRFRLPPLDEQRRVSGILGAFDDKIDVYRRLATSLESILQVQFRELMSRASVTHVKAIADLADRVVDRVASPTEWQHEVLIDLGRMPERSLLLAEWGLGAELSTSVTRFDRGDILFGAIRPYFHKVGIAPMPGITNTSVFVIRARRPQDQPFVAAWCSSAEVVGHATRSSHGTTMPVVSWADFSRFDTPIPHGEEREEFGRLNGALIDRIAAIASEIQTLAAVRAQLLPSLLREAAPSPQGRAEDL